MYDEWFSGRNKVSVLNKNMCGNGGTTGIIDYHLDKFKGCLILTPNVSIVKSKEAQYKGNSEVCCVYGGIGEFNINATVVVATYDQFGSLLKSLSKSGMDETRFWAGRNIIIDEYHKLVDECDFRDVMSKVVNKIAKIDMNVLFMSATEHTGLLNMLQELYGGIDICVYDIDYSYKRSIKSDRLNFYDINKKDVCSIIKMVKDRGESAVVFYNSVNEIKNIINMIGDDYCEILCSESRKDETGEYYSDDFDPKKQIHFCTSAYFTGCDFDVVIDHCMIIGSSKHTNMSYSDRDIRQMLGRFRKGVRAKHILNIKSKVVDKKEWLEIKDKYDDNTE